MTDAHSTSQQPFRFMLLLLSIAFVFHEADAQALYVTNDGYLASTNKELLKRATELLDDDEAFAQFLQDNYPDLFQLKKGIEVYLVDTDWGYVKVRPKRQSTEIWTYREAVSPKRPKRPKK
ncbi:MAG: hypothetical protein WB626_00910 [Bacteroidota bacterium]